MSRKPNVAAPAKPAVAKTLVKAKPVKSEAVAETPVVEPAIVEPGTVEAAAEAVIETVEPEVEAVPEPTSVVAAEETIESNPVVTDSVPAATVETASPAPTPKPSPVTPPRGMKIMIKSTEEIVAFNQANVEAFVKSGQIWAAGVQELTKQMASTAKTSFDESVSTFKALSTVKSFKEALDLQSAFAKTSFEKAVAESNKLTDASIKLTEQTLAPITARVTVAVETFGNGKAA